MKKININNISTKVYKILNTVYKSKITEHILIGKSIDNPYNAFLKIIINTNSKNTNIK